jgi:DNA-binding NarL/FixJ family response regulator
MSGLFQTASPGNTARKFIRGRQLDRRAPPVPKKAQREPRKAQPPVKRDEVAELLSDGLEFDQIAERMGITLKAVRRHFEKIRELMGPQAC